MSQDLFVSIQFGFSPSGAPLFEFFVISLILSSREYLGRMDMF